MILPVLSVSYFSPFGASLCENLQEPANLKKIKLVGPQCGWLSSRAEVMRLRRLKALML